MAPAGPAAGSERLPFAFAGTAWYARLVLAGLLAAGRRPVALVTNPDRPRGRHGTPQPPEIVADAGAAGVPVLQPATLDEGLVETLRDLGAAAVVVCAYGRIVPAALLDRLPWLVVHPSLVPRWRGAAPVERALMAGETTLGVSILRMTAGVDEGPVGWSQAVPVPPDADAGEAYRLLTPPAVAGVAAVLDGLADGSVAWREQVGEPTYAAKLGPGDRRIDWSRPAAAIVNQVRALSPHIGAVTELAGRRTLIWRARVGEGERPDPHEGRLGIPAGEGWVEVLDLQQEGRRRVGAAEFLRGAGRALLEGEGWPPAP